MERWNAFLYHSRKNSYNKVGLSPLSITTFIKYNIKEITNGYINVKKNVRILPISYTCVYLFQITDTDFIIK